MNIIIAMMKNDKAENVKKNTKLCIIKYVQGKSGK